MWERCRACGDSACLQPPLLGCNNHQCWWTLGEPLCWGPVWVQTLGSPCKLQGNLFLESHLPSSQVVWLWWVKRTKAQLPSTAARPKPCMQACQGTPKLVSLGAAAKAAAKWLGRMSHWWASPSLGRAAKGHPTALGSPWVSQRQMLEGEHSAKQKATINISVCSQRPLSWLLMRKFTVRKAIVLTKMCASKCLQKATRGGPAKSKGRVPWNRVGFEEHHCFLWVCLLLIWLHWTGSLCGGVAPHSPAANSLFPETWGAGNKRMALGPWSPRMWCHMCSPWDGGDLFPSYILLPRCLKLKAVGQIQCVPLISRRAGCTKNCDKFSPAACLLITQQERFAAFYSSYRAPKVWGTGNATQVKFWQFWAHQVPKIMKAMFSWCSLSLVIKHPFIFQHLMFHS